jgi:phosphate transport system permease protein
MATVDVAVPRTVTARALRGHRVDVAGLVFQGLLLFSLIACLAIIVTLIWTVASDSSGVFEERGFVIGAWPDEIGNTVSDIATFLAEPAGLPGWIFTLAVVAVVPLGLYAAFRRSWKLGVGIVAGVAGLVVFAGLLQTSDFVTSPLSRISERAGIAQAIFGSLVLAAIVIAVAMPLGIATAVYLEEYAPTNRFTNLVRLNIRNLAGVPSVVYGILGLTIFVKTVGAGKTVIAGGLTLAVLVLPIVIITASESIRAVPQALREGGYGVGATKWEVQRTLVLPNAFAGILTGTILAVSRAIGETAPLILVGAFFGTFFTTGNANLWDKFDATYTALPQVVFQWAREPAEEFKISLTAAAIIALLAVTLFANVTAILLRNRFEKRW